MRTGGVWIFALAFGCSNASDDPGLGGGAGGLDANGGTAGSTGGAMGGAAPTGGSVARGGSSGGGTGGSVARGGGAGSAVSGGAPTGGMSGGSGSAGMSDGGTSGGGNTFGGAGSNGQGGVTPGGNGGKSGASGAAAGGRGGAAMGGTAGATTGGTGGASACVENLACTLSPPPSTGDIYQDCVDRINQFLTQCACLPALTRRTDGEDCANQMAEYDAMQDTAHAGIRANICQPGGSQNECPGYSSNSQVIGLCMQQMWDEGPPPTADCTGSCYEEHGHFINMTDDGVTKVACGFYTTSSGKVWAVQNFSR